MDNGSIFNLVRYIANKESRGGVIRVPDFNMQLQNKNIQLLNELLGLGLDYNPRNPNKNQKNISVLVDDRTNRFKKKTTINFVGGLGNLPSDYFRYDAILVVGAYAGVEILFGPELGARMNNAIDSPSALFPIGTFADGKVLIYPNTIAAADMFYYRNPVTPVFDFYVNAIGEIVYMPEGTQHTLSQGEVHSSGVDTGTVTSLSIELEWGDAEKISIAYMILMDMGVSLNRGDVAQYAQIAETKK